jgi:three-Cys-motif partner protein
MRGLPEVGPWAKEKLDALRRYLEFYTTILKKRSWRKIYLDAYAGGGRAVVRRTVAQEPSQTNDLGFFEEQPPIDIEERELIDGSPRIALAIANPFDRYVFVDPSPDRAAELQQLKKESSHRTIDVLEMTATAGIDWLMGQKIGKATHRGVAFLDPFGAKLEWSSIQKLADTGLFEVFVNFALNMAIVRMLPNSADVPPTWASTLDSYFGGRDWFEEVYHRPTGLFGLGDLEKRPDYMERLLELIAPS